MTPASLDPLSYLIGSFGLKDWGLKEVCASAHLVAKKAAIVFKISVSLFDVSSNPGVSMRVTFLPSRVNLFASWTSAVQDSRPIPIRRSEPLARLIN